MAKRITFEGELQLGHLSMLAAASARELYVEELHRLAEKDERIVFVGADSGYGGAENKFREKYPDRMLPVWHCAVKFRISQALARFWPCALWIRCIPISAIRICRCVSSIPTRA